MKKKQIKLRRVVSNEFGDTAYPGHAFDVEKEDEHVFHIKPVSGIPGTMPVRKEDAIVVSEKYE